MFRFPADKRAYLVEALGEAKVFEMEANHKDDESEFLKMAGEFGVQFKGEKSSWISEVFGLR